ncbi:hypothetical protein [Nonomuraea sp. NPDC050643]|uniref:hypothetical protein n=1 Tax=Nonomuraea sp. NPDC050643 TaxID=3155660 RepID=UPI0033F368AF
MLDRILEDGRAPAATGLIPAVGVAAHAAPRFLAREHERCLPLPERLPRFG